MDTIRLFLRTNSFRNSIRKNDSLRTFDRNNHNSKRTSFESEGFICENPNPLSLTKSTSNKKTDVKDTLRSRRRRHSWTVEKNPINSFSSIRRSKSAHYHHRQKTCSIPSRSSTERTSRRIIALDRSSKSVSFPISHNLRPASHSVPSVKTTATNAFLTATSLLKYWVYLSPSHVWRG
jgi:hypothetical protein